MESDRGAFRYPWIRRKLRAVLRFLRCGFGESEDQPLHPVQETSPTSEEFTNPSSVRPWN